MATHRNPTRDGALRQLAAFVPEAGRTYAERRNFDSGPGRHDNVSTLSPYIRHRLIAESEVVAAVLRVHSPAAAEKFIQEVCWRTYWKGWLEQRPSVWTAYLQYLAAQRDALQDDQALAADVSAAMQGNTGIACIDAWAGELIETGYLHNHARMWFASIWIFTLRLPWVVGADFFLRHLLDGDPASNTLSWRWVAGLHTPGKTYLARADNIATYTGGRFTPERNELAPLAVALTETERHDLAALRPAAQPQPGTKVVLLVTDEDLSPETWPLEGLDVQGIAMFDAGNSEANHAPLVSAFKAGARADAASRAVAHWRVPLLTVDTPADLVAFARKSGAAAVVTTTVPVGYLRPELSAWAAACATDGVPLIEIARPWDRQFWPHAKAGFFQLKAQIPAVLAKLDLAPQRTLL